MSTSASRNERAAALLGRGWKVKDAAREVGVHAETVTRWRREDPSFRALEQQARDARLSGEKPTVRAVLEAALTATRQDGVDWAARLKAAQLLLTQGEQDAKNDEPKPTLVWVYPDGD